MSKKQQILQRAKHCGLIKDPPTVQISIRLSTQALAEVDSLAKVMGTNRSQLIAQFVERELRLLLEEKER